METKTLERELHIDAAPEVVFDVISSPQHIRDWWRAETAIEPKAGSASELTWRDEASGQVKLVPITVVDAQPPRLFSFRWTQGVGEAPTESNSLLVTFELSPSDAGTTLRFTETGYSERADWDAETRENTYQDHTNGWGFYLPRIAELAARVVSAR